MRLLLVIMLISLPAYAAENQCKVVEPIKAKKRAAVKTMPKKAAVQPMCSTCEEKKCCEKTTEQTISQSSATTGSQTVTINLPPPQPRVLSLYKERSVEKTKMLYKPNRLQLLLGLSKTDLDIKDDGCCSVTAKTKREPDIGLQYLRDFGSFTGSVMGTINENVYVGVGFNW